MREYLAQVTKVSKLTLSIVELHVQVTAPETPAFQAGQFMQFQIAGQERSYSIASPPAENNPNLVFCIELLQKGLGSDFVRNLKVGDSITMNGPYGDLTISDRSRDLFFVATGVGIAPFCSIVPDLLGRGFAGKVRLLFGLRNEENVFYYHKFNSLTTLHPNFRFIPILSQPQSHWPGEIGRVTTYLDVTYQAYKQSVFYLCGGPDMVKDARQVLLRHDHPNRDIKVEIFS